MIIYPYNYEANKARKGLPIIDSADKSSSTGLFSPEIFGVTEEERTTKSALITHGCYVLRPIITQALRRINRKLVACTTSRTPYYIRKGILYEKDDSYEALENDIVGYGPMFLYNNWHKLDLTQFEQEFGKFTNKELKKTLSILDRNQIFKAYTYVIPIAYREESEDGQILVNDWNLLYADIIRYSNIIKTLHVTNQSIQLQSHDIEVMLQNAVNALGDYIKGRYMGPHGVGRKQILSRNVDNSARMVIIPTVWRHRKIGQSKINSRACGIPIQHLMANFRETIVKFSKNFIDELHSRGYFPKGVSTDLLSYYDIEFLTDAINKLEDPFFRVSDFPAICLDGTFQTIQLEFTIIDENTNEEIPITKPLSWIEFFYIVQSEYAKLYDSRYILMTRPPVDSMTSSQPQKPYCLTLTPTLLKHVKVFGFDFDEFPLVDSYIKENYQNKIFDTGARLMASNSTAMNADHDGDALLFKPLNTKEAMQDAKRMQESPLFMLNYNGSLARRNPGKDCNQTWYSVSRDPKPKDHAGKADLKNPFIQHLLHLENGEMDIELFYENALSYHGEKPPVNIYDEITILYKKKKIKTTVGRLMLNKCMMYPVWEHPQFEYINHPLYFKELSNIWRMVVQLEIEGKLDPDTHLKMLDASNEFGLRLSTVCNAGITMSMMNPDKKFSKIRDTEMNKAVESYKKTGDIRIIGETITKLQTIAKDYYKDDDMMELYDSNNSADITNDWSALNISMGSLPELVGGKVTVIPNSLADGVEPQHLSSLSNVAMKGAMDRGYMTAYAGTLYKDLVNGMQSIKSIEGDCGSKITKEMQSNDKFDYLNHYILEGNKEIHITLENVNKYVGKKVHMRYPLGCKKKDGHFCSHCIGDLLHKTSPTKDIPIGIYTSEIGSAMLNTLMKSTHSLGANMFTIEDWNTFVYPGKRRLFEHKLDPISNQMKIYCLEDIDWILPMSAITPVENYYQVLAHGSILETASGEQNTIIYGSEVVTLPSEIIKPKDEEEIQMERHVTFRYRKGDAFLNSTTSLRYNMTVYKMFKIFFGGNLSNLVPLDTHLDTIKNCINANVKIASSDLSVEIVLASLARDIHDPTKPARETGSKEYKFISLYELGVLGGTFNAVFGSDAAKSILINLARSEEEQTKTISPLERALRY